jgi:N-acetylmuramoyl-L-alanine amidase
MIKRSLLFFTAVFILTLLFSFNNPGGKQKVLKTIIIDAGHGIMANGGYNGAKGSYSHEDDICLAVAKELVTQLREALPEVKIIETRLDENIVDLHRRAEIANENKADLFISIHCNAAVPIKHSERIGTKTITMTVGKGKKKRTVKKKVPEYRYWTTPNPAKGTETYIWGAHKNEDKEVAVRENAAMMEEENYKEVYGDVDVNSPEFIALSLLKTKQFFKRSATLSGFVEDEFYKTGRTSRGQQQRQVGIWVLQATAMPSVLVETGYITNSEEEDYLNSKEGQKEISTCITNAVKTYINWLEKGKVNNEQPQPSINQTDSTSSPKSAASFLELIDNREKKINGVRK